jgi:isopentenyl-diphosphate delta-isomerase
MNEHLRKKRKSEHIRHAIDLFKYKICVFSDFNLVHNCLPEIDLEQIDITTELAGIKLNNPLIINAITGGTPESEEINYCLAVAARETGVAIAVGSQSAALKDPSAIPSFNVVRRQNPDGIVFANISAGSSPDDAIRAVEMVQADALQLHLNIAQELAMFEGEKHFTDRLLSIEKIVKAISVPVIIKEVGFGISRNEARRLKEIGVKVIDIGGKGGTNFISIENLRSKQHDAPIVSPSFTEWGIPTDISLVEVCESVKNSVDIVASGGIYTGVNSVKAFTIGAKAIGIAGLLLYVLKLEGLNKLIDKIEEIIREIKYTLLLIGAKNIEQARQMPVVITGFSAQWLRTRGFDIEKYAQRDTTSLI